MLNKLAEEIHQNAVEHGWWDKDREFGSIIALMHSELSEALEEYRNKHEPDEIYYSCSDKHEECCVENICSDGCILGKPEGIPIELADCIIRILDYCGRERINIDEAIKIKHEYNKTRPYRHGGKAI